MWYDSVRESLKFGSARPRAGRVRAAKTRLAVELLEDRCLLSSYNFTLIADTGPSSPYSGLALVPAINDLGDVAYEGNLRSGGAGIFARNHDGSSKIIAITSEVIRTFVLSPYMNNIGIVSFGADLTDGARGIFKGSGQELTRIADTEPYSPFSSFPLNPAPRVHYDGTVDFTANLNSGGKGFFVGNGGLPSILYVTGGQFSEFPGSGARQYHGDTVNFRATLQDGTRGVFTGTGGPTTTIATLGGEFDSFIGTEINDEGTVFFSANLTMGGQVIVVAQDGMLKRFVDTSGPFSQFFAGQVSLNNEGLIVFDADLAAGGTGMFDGTDPVANKIIATGDELLGSTVVGLLGINPKGLNNAGQIVFRADLADGRRVIVRADPDNASVQGGPTPLPLGDIGFNPAFVSVTVAATTPMSPSSIPLGTGPSLLFWRDPDGILLPPVAVDEGQPERPHVASSLASYHATTRAVLDCLFADFGEETLPFTDK